MNYARVLLSASAARSTISRVIRGFSIHLALGKAGPERALSD
jgi:hypothetical protein